MNTRTGSLDAGRALAGVHTFRHRQSSLTVCTDRTYEQTARRVDLHRSPLHVYVGGPHL